MRRDLEKFYKRIDNIEIYGIGNKVFEFRMNEFTSILSKHKKLFGSKALDLGCGGGASTFALEKLGLNVVGVDIQEEMISMAREAAKKMKSKAIFLRGNILEVDIKEKFDSVFMLGNLLAHLSVIDFAKLLNRIKGFLKKKGVLVIHYADTLMDILRGEFFTISPELRRDNVVFNYNAEKGAFIITIIERKIREDLFEADRFTVYIWSPWIIENIMLSNEYELLIREHLPRSMFLDIYRKK